MTEIYADCRPLTLDGDFEVYRRNGLQVIPVVIPHTGM